jgi:hypothetical protein
MTRTVEPMRAATAIRIDIDSLLLHEMPAAEKRCSQCI